MERNENHVPAPQRRVGTLTMGATLVVSGVWMLVTMFFPQADPTWLLKGSPLILVSLGVETLLSARSGGRVKYDWVGMLLCLLLTCTALCLYAAAWWLVWHPQWQGSVCF